MPEGPPWHAGERVMFATFDDPQADLREQDGNTGVVVEYSAERDYLIVQPDGGGWPQIECDPYAVVSA
jgi:hypothetical protein